MDPERIRFVEQVIEHEKGSIETYRLLAQRMREEGDHNAAALCESLVEEETRHKTMLESLGAQELRFVQERIDKIGGYALHATERFSYPVEDSKTDELFDMAIEREKTSIQQYQALKEAATSDDVRRFFKDMAHEEERHLEMISDEKEKVRRFRKRPF